MQLLGFFEMSVHLEQQYPCVFYDFVKNELLLLKLVILHLIADVANNTLGSESLLRALHFNFAVTIVQRPILSFSQKLPILVV